MTLSPGQLVAGKYRVERLLAEGGMGAVYIAENQVLQKRVAIKVMNEAFAAIPGATERFLREGVAASRVSHPAIVQVFDAGEHEGAPWLAMELLQGQSLGERIATRGPLSLPELMVVCRGVLPALAAVHQQGLVHRDLKPDNIFLAEVAGGSFQPKLLDFGVAKDTRGGVSKLTATGAVVGTASYLAPEQARGAEIDARTDIYAMGAVIYESLSGALPYEADTLTQLVAKMFTEAPVPLAQVAPQVPDAICEVVGRCLAQQPDQRYATATDLLAALEAAATGVTPERSSIAYASTAAGLPGTGAPVAPTPSLTGGPPQMTTGAGQAQAPSNTMQPSMGGAVQPPIGGMATAPTGAMIPPGAVAQPTGVAGSGRRALWPILMAAFGLGVLVVGGAFYALTAKDTGDARARVEPPTTPPPTPAALPPTGAPTETPTLPTGVEVPTEDGTAPEDGPDAQRPRGADHRRAARRHRATREQDDTPAATAQPTAPTTSTTPATPTPASPSSMQGGPSLPPGVAAAPAAPLPTGVRAAPMAPGPSPSPPTAPTMAPPAATAPRAAAGLSPAQLNPVVQSVMPRMERCYTRASRRYPGLAGTISVGFVVGPGGRVQQARALRDEVNNPWMQRCVLQQVQRMRFPAARNGLPTRARRDFHFGR